MSNIKSPIWIPISLWRDTTGVIGFQINDSNLPPLTKVDLNPNTIIEACVVGFVNLCGYFVTCINKSVAVLNNFVGVGE